jgi:hypothetical protein
METKALILMMAMDEVSDGVYPDESSHGARHKEVESDLILRHAELLYTYSNAVSALEYIKSEGQ